MGKEDETKGHGLHTLQAETDYDKKHRLLQAKDKIRDKLRDRERFRNRGGLEPIPVDEIERIKRQLRVAFAVLNKYETILDDGEELTESQEKMLNAQQDIIRKLETTLSALKSKADLGKKSDLELAKEFLKDGMSREEVLALYSHSPEVQEKL